MTRRGYRDWIKAKLIHRDHMKSGALTIAIFFFVIEGKEKRIEWGGTIKIKQCLFETRGRSYPSCTYLPSLSIPSLLRRTIYIHIKLYSLLEVSLAHIVRLSDTA